MFQSYILFELLDVEHGSPISHKSVKWNNLGLALAIDIAQTPMGDSVTYEFLILHYRSHKIKYVNPLRVAALTCNITLRTLPTK